MAGFLAGSIVSPAIAAQGESANPYLKIGVRPFINTVAAFTINGGLQTRPEVKQAMEEASYYSVNLDELKLAHMLRSKSAIVTAGVPLPSRTPRRRLSSVPIRKRYSNCQSWKV